MSNQRLLEGEVIGNGDASELRRLRDEIDGLRRERDSLRSENKELRERLRQADAPAARLREKLNPFYQLLQSIYGDLDEIAPDADAGEPASPTAKASPVWEAWKQRLGATTAKGIDALLIHGELNTQQLAIATGLNRNTITNAVVFKLNKAGLINKNGGRFSLKSLGT